MGSGKHRRKPSSHPSPQPYRFTKRQDQVLERLLAAESEKQIAAALRISIHTVHKYVRQIYEITGVSSRSELLVKMLGQGRPEQDLSRVEQNLGGELLLVRVPLIRERLD